MPTPILIDTDMGVDDAIAMALAFSAKELQVAGLASVGGNVSLEQATGNIGRVLGTMGIVKPPPVGKGLDQAAGLLDATHVFGPDGLGETNLPIPAGYSAIAYDEIYTRCIEAHGETLVIIAIGPLTNLAALLRDKPGLLQRAGRIVIMGGAVWCPGNVNRWTEFNFYRDPQAAADVFSAGLPLTVVSLDVTRQVAMDESHLAHLSRAGGKVGEILARMISYPLEHHVETTPGKFLVHDAVAVGTLLWPELFMRSRVGLEIITAGEQAGRSKPVVTRDKNKQAHVVISVNVLDFFEKLLERICHEEFIV